MWSTSRFADYALEGRVRRCDQQTIPIGEISNQDIIAPKKSNCHYLAKDMSWFCDDLGQHTSQPSARAIMQVPAFCARFLLDLAAKHL